MKNVYSKSKKGFVWTLASNGVKGGLGFLTLFFLTYFLGTEGMGIISILMVIYGLSETFVQFGISQSIISREKTTRNELTSIFWANLFIGFFVFLVVNLLANQIANFYNQPDILIYLRILSVVFLIEPLELVFRAVLEKELEFPKLEKVNIVKSVVKSICIIIFVILGFNIFGYIYAILFSTLLAVAIFTLVFIRKKWWLPSFYFRFQDIKKHYKFGAYVTTRSVLNYIGYHFDELIIGKILGVEALGVYYFAKKLLSQVTQLLISSFNKISFPLFSKLKIDIYKFRKAYLNLTEFFSSWSFFFFTFIILIVPHIIPVIWGDAWLDSIVLIQVFSLVAILQTLSNGFGPPALYIFNKPALVFKIDFFITPLRLIVITIASLVSIEFVAVVLFLTVLVKMIWLQKEVNKEFGMSFKDYYFKLKIPFENVLLSLIPYFFLLFLSNIFNLIVLDVYLPFIFSVFYIILFFKRDKGSYMFIKKEIINLLNHKKNGKMV